MTAKAFFIVGLLSFFLAGSSGIMAQEAEVSITVKNPKGQVMAGAKVALKEAALGLIKEGKTNAAGAVSFHLTEGSLWDIFINDSEVKNKVEMPDAGKSVRSMTITFNPELTRRRDAQITDRTGFSEEKQSWKPNDRPQSGKAFVKVQVTTREGVPQNGAKVRVVDIKNKKAYMAVTTVGGWAFFMLPVSTNYDIDVEDMLNNSMVDLDARPNMIVGVTCFYDKPKVNEQRHGDTIVQKLQSETPASGRAYYVVKVHHPDRTPAANEMIYLAEIHGKDVYQAQTDARGEARFLLPIGKKYMIHFNFERDVDVVNLNKVVGYVQGYIELTYRPNPKLQHPELFIPKRDEIFLVDFQNFLTKQFPKPPAPAKVGLFTRWGNKINEKSREAVLEIGYTADGQGKQVAANLALVIDNSGSMSGYYRIERLKEALVHFIEKLSPQSYVSLITFESKMEILSEPVLVGPNRQKLIDAVKSIESKGGTNMLEALGKGYEFVMKNYNPRFNNRVLLLTDGYDENRTEDLLKVQAPYNLKVECTAMGVGEDYNYALLTQLASNGRGLLRFVGESDQFQKVFDEELSQVLSPVASEVTFEISFPEKFKFRHLHGMEAVNSKGNPVIYQTANLYHGANRIAFAKFDLIHPGKDLESIPVTVKMKYRNTETGEMEVIEQKVYLDWEDWTGQYEVMAEAEQKKLLAIAEMNRAIKLMSEYYEAGQNARAQKILEETTSYILNLYPGARPEEVSKLMDSLEQYLEAFRNLSRKQLLEKKPKKKS